LTYPPELLQKLKEAGHDPSTFLISRIDTTKTAKKVEEVTDPILKKISKLEEENLLAFRISKEGFDTVYNIGHHWTFNMVQECQIYIDSLNEYQEREMKKSERNA
jgi:hypothetical protein